MRLRVGKMLVASVVVLGMPCRAAKKAKPHLYRNERSGFCAEVPANWNGPAEVANHDGGRFDAPGGNASITFALSSNRPRSIVLGEKNAGSQMATLDDYHEAIPNTWRNDPTVSDVNVTQDKSVTLNGSPAIRLELAYKRAGANRRYEIVFALSNNEQYAVEYDVAKRSAKKYEIDFRGAVNSFEFQCQANGR